MEEDSGISLTALNVDGGASSNDFLMQFQSDILGVQVDRPEVVETTALGAAYLAGLAVGYWESKNSILQNRKIEKTFKPDMEELKRTKLLKGWHRAVKRAAEWEVDED
jgi:glycerol kinase